MKKLVLILTLSVIMIHSYGQSEVKNDSTQTTLLKLYQESEVGKRLKISGYIQAQYQLADSAGQAGFAGGNFPSGTDNRFAVRRGRVKFIYDSQANRRGISTSQLALQIDVSEKGLSIKDAYIKITDPWTGWVSLTAGMQMRPFGYELQYTSSMRESPERGRMSQIIFPGERDLGAMITIQGPKSSKWNHIKLDAGLFNGTGARGPGLDASDFDKKKDFIGRLSYSKPILKEKGKFGIGVSYYDGGFRQDPANRYIYGADQSGVKGYVIDLKSADVPADVASRGFTKRNYTGIDAQFSIDWFPGITTLRAEYIQGTQPAISSGSASPAAPFTTTVNSSYVLADTAGTPHVITTTSVVASDIYVRKFNGAYFYFLQNIGQLPLQAILKYDWYDPNTDVAGDEIGKKVTSEAKATNATDIKYSTFGFGLAYRWDSNVKITAYYDMVKNETSANLSGYTADLKDNVFTLRLQLKF